LRITRVKHPLVASAVNPLNVVQMLDQRLTLHIIKRADFVPHPMQRANLRKKSDRPLQARL